MRAMKWLIWLTLWACAWLNIECSEQYQINTTRTVSSNSAINACHKLGATMCVYDKASGKVTSTINGVTTITDTPADVVTTLVVQAGASPIYTSGTLDCGNPNNCTCAFSSSFTIQRTEAVTPIVVDCKSKSIGVIAMGTKPISRYTCDYKFQSVPYLEVKHGGVCCHYTKYDSMCGGTSTCGVYESQVGTFAAIPSVQTIATSVCNTIEFQALWPYAHNQDMEMGTEMHIPIYYRGLGHFLASKNDHFLLSAAGLAANTANQDNYLSNYEPSAFETFERQDYTAFHVCTKVETYNYVALDDGVKLTVLKSTNNTATLSVDILETGSPATVTVGVIYGSGAITLQELTLPQTPASWSACGDVTSNVLSILHATNDGTQLGADVSTKVGTALDAGRDDVIFHPMNVVHPLGELASCSKTDFMTNASKCQRTPPGSKLCSNYGTLLSKNAGLQLLSHRVKYTRTTSDVGFFATKAKCYRESLSGKDQLLNYFYKGQVQVTPTLTMTVIDDSLLYRYSIGYSAVSVVSNPTYLHVRVTGCEWCLSCVYQTKCYADYNVSTPSVILLTANDPSRYSDATLSVSMLLGTTSFPMGIYDNITIVSYSYSVGGITYGTTSTMNLTQLATRTVIAQDVSLPVVVPDRGKPTADYSLYIIIGVVVGVITLLVLALVCVCRKKNKLERYTE